MFLFCILALWSVDQAMIPPASLSFRLDKTTLSWVTDLDYHPARGLVALDGLEHRLHLWDKDGNHLISFGSQGEGPGEFQRPARIFATADTIYLFTYQRRIYEYDRQGNHLKTLNVHGTPFDIQSMGVTQNGTIILGGRHYDQATNTSKMMFGRLGTDGVFHDSIAEFADIGVLKVKSPNGLNADIIAYAPQTCIQADHSGTLYIGYGSAPEIHRLKADGSRDATFSYPLRTGPPTEDERNRFENLEFFVGRGRYAKLRDFKGITVMWDRDKGYYSDFTLSDPEQVVFNLTPMGQVPFALANGHYWGWLSKAEHDGQKAATKQLYDYSEDNILFLKRGYRFLTYQQRDENLEIRLIKPQ